MPEEDPLCAEAADEIERLRAIVHADPLSRMHMLDQAHQDIRYLCERLNSIEAASAGLRDAGVADMSFGESEVQAIRDELRAHWDEYGTHGVPASVVAWVMEDTAWTSTIRPDRS